MSRTSAIGAAGALCWGIAQAQDVPYPDGFHTWYHHHTTVNQDGHQPAGNVGIQHVYANDLAVEGLKTGSYRDGAMFVVDHYAISAGENHTLNQGDRKVVAVMLRNASGGAGTGGWVFAAFKGGDPAKQVVKDQNACFSCHAPLGDNNYLFTRGLR